MTKIERLFKDVVVYNMTTAFEESSIYMDNKWEKGVVKSVSFSYLVRPISANCVQGTVRLYVPVDVEYWCATHKVDKEHKRIFELYEVLKRNFEENNQ